MNFLASLKHALVGRGLRTGVFEQWLRRKVRKLETASARALGFNP